MHLPRAIVFGDTLQEADKVRKSGFPVKTVTGVLAGVLGTCLLAGVAFLVATSSHGRQICKRLQHRDSLSTAPSMDETVNVEPRTHSTSLASAGNLHKSATLASRRGSSRSAPLSQFLSHRAKSNVEAEEMQWTLTNVVYDDYGSSGEEDGRRSHEEQGGWHGVQVDRGSDGSHR